MQEYPEDRVISARVDGHDAERRILYWLAD